MTAAVGNDHDRNLLRLKRHWRTSSLAFQFLTVGGAVSLFAALLVGLLVTSLIERAVTRNAAATTALYVDSVIAPLLPDLQRNVVLTDPIKRALDETLGQGALADRLLAMRIWSTDGTILYATNEMMVGRQFALGGELERAADGEMGARYEDQGTGHEAAGFTTSAPLLAIYNPLLQPWSGEVVAVMEFYELAHELHEELRTARRWSWLAVAGTTAVFFLVLSAIVLRGSRTIDDQAQRLSVQVQELTRLLAKNEALEKRVRKAAQRTTALNESHLRRLGADLHDGPAQLIALASLRLDSEALAATSTPPEERERELGRIRDSLGNAMREIRTICRGLVLPQIETAGFADVVSRAIDDYEQRTGMAVERRIGPVDFAVPLPHRICGYRFVQEALNNGYRHCPGAPQSVAVETEGRLVRVEVSDRGPGFNPEKVRTGSIGIEGMRDRVESLGGIFHLRSSPAGTTLKMSLEIEEGR